MTIDLRDILVLLGAVFSGTGTGVITYLLKERSRKREIHRRLAYLEGDYSHFEESIDVGATWKPVLPGRRSSLKLVGPGRFESKGWTDGDASGTFRWFGELQTVGDSACSASGDFRYSNQETWNGAHLIDRNADGTLLVKVIQYRPTRGDPAVRLVKWVRTGPCSPWPPQNNKVY